MKTRFPLYDELMNHTAAFVIIAFVGLTAFWSLADAAEESSPLSRALVLEPTRQSPRNSEGSFVALKDGRLLFVYTHFTGGEGDAAAANLVARFSHDEGRSWDADEKEVVGREGKMNVMSVSLLRLADGRIAMFYLVKNSGTDNRLYMRTSSDEALTWNDSVLCIPTEGYYVVNNDRVIQLKSGRLVVPAAQHNYVESPGSKPTHRGKVTCFLSDDGGKTWRAGKTTLEAPANSHSGLQEPGVVELKNGDLLMLIRTDLGSQYRSISSDGGESWSAAEPTELASPLSPASIKRVPTTDDLMVIWNDHRGTAKAMGAKRSPLSVALSKDEGKTWLKSKTLESDPDGHYCYTAILFVNDRVLIGYGGLNRKPLQVCSFGLDWLNN